MKLLRRTLPVRLALCCAVVSAFGAEPVPAEPGTAPGPLRLGGFSARTRVAPGSPQIIVFATAGEPPSRLLLRAIGRGLPAGLGTDVLPTPVLSLYEGDRLIAEDRGSAIAPAMAELARATGAFPVGPSGVPAFSNHGSALAPTLARGTFALATTSGDRGAGAVLVECHPLAPAGGAAGLRHFSVRGQTGPGDAVMIAGFIISEGPPVRVLARGLGSALGRLGVTGAVLDPRLELFAAAGALPLARGEPGTGGQAGIAAAARRVGAFPLTDGSRDAALLVTLGPGAYTALLSSATNARGQAMLELYLLDDAAAETATGARPK